MTTLVKAEVFGFEALDLMVERILMKKSMIWGTPLKRRTRNIELRLEHRLPRESHQKTTYPKDVHCNPWNL